MPFNPSDYAELEDHFFGVAALQADEAANDSDKTLTVPAGKLWRVLHVWVELTSTATVGNRQMTLELQDSAADVIGSFAAGAVQAASLTRNYIFAPQLPDLTSFRAGDLLMTPIPTILLPAAYKIRIYDSAAVDAAADDMVVQAMVAVTTPTA